MEAIVDGTRKVRMDHSIARGSMYAEQVLETAALTGGHVLSNSTSYVLSRQMSGSFRVVTTAHGSRQVCRGADLARLFASITLDSEFADDIEAGLRERRAMAEFRVSPWER